MPFHPRSLPVALVPNPLSGRHLELNLRWQARRRPCRYSAVKLLLSHIAGRHFELDDLERRWPRARRIVVVRRHFGLQYLSWRTAVETDQFELRRGSEPRRATLEVDLDHFRAWRAQVLARIRALANHPTGRCALWLVYEDLDGAPAAAFRDAVWPFLGLPDAPVRSGPTIRQRHGTIEERVANFRSTGAELDGAVLPIETPGGCGHTVGPPSGLLP